MSGVICTFKKIYLLERQKELQIAGQGERDRNNTHKNLHPLVYSPNGQNSKNQPSREFNPGCACKKNRDPDICNIFYCFSRHMSRTLDQKQSSLGQISNLVWYASISRMPALNNTKTKFKTPAIYNGVNEQNIQATNLRIVGLLCWSPAQQFSG